MTVELAFMKLDKLVGTRFIASGCRVHQWRRGIAANENS